MSTRKKTLQMDLLIIYLTKMFLIENGERDESETCAPNKDDHRRTDKSFKLKFFLFKTSLDYCFVFVPWLKCGL